MNNDPYDGWEGFCHPDAPAGGGGPGFFRSAYPAGMGMDEASDSPHPDSPAARTSLVAVTVGAQDAAKPSAFLETFASGIGDYSAEELNEALYTLFGELSSQLHDEFRCFVKERTLVGISQYHCRQLRHYPEIEEHARSIECAIRSFTVEVLPLLHLDDLVLDVFLETEERQTSQPFSVKLLDVNPFFPKTDACLFSWRSGGDFDGSFRFL